MAADVYLQIDGVKGESRDDKHKDWIELDSVGWGVGQSVSDTLSTSGGHTTGRSEFRPISCARTVDMASPLLMLLCAQGKTIPKARIQFVRADGSNTVCYYEIELENVLVANVGKTFPGAGLLHESFELRYTQIKEKYTQQKIGGGTNGSTAGGWNLATNKAA